MPRNYKKEADWQKDKYARLSAFVDKEAAEKLKEYLAQNGTTYADWLREKIKETIGEGRSE